jgi:hypothetical protein
VMPVMSAFFIKGVKVVLKCRAIKPAGRIKFLHNRQGRRFCLVWR